jgi:hypothetical protein
MAQSQGELMEILRRSRKPGQADHRQDICRLRAVIAGIKAQAVGCGYEKIPIGGAHLNPMAKEVMSSIVHQDGDGSKALPVPDAMRTFIPASGLPTLHFQKAHRWSRS